MPLSEFCIRRPVFTTLLMFVVIIGGIAGYLMLPVSSLPNVDFPTIQVQADLPGASPKMVAASVATPLERQFATIEGITSITSTSFLGTTQITLQFDLSRNISGAAVDVQSAISAAVPKLPKEMQNSPTFKKVNPSDQPVIFIALSSDSMPMYKVNEYADTMIGQQISMLLGVSKVIIYGEQKYAIRVRVNPESVAARGLSMDEVATAVSAAASITPGGDISGKEQLFTIDIQGQPRDAKSYNDIIIKYQDNGPVRFSDVGQAIDSVENTRSIGFINGKQAIVMAVQRQPGSNTVEVVSEVLKILPKLQKQLPPSIELTPMFNQAESIKDSIYDVEGTLMLAIVLVVLTIFLFLRRLYATLIPAMVIPISILGTLGCMALLGFSIDNISLLAITLSVGFVVDDAIVMIENIVRHIEKGQSPFQAALSGAKEIGFTIISMTLSLVAVFIPVLFMGGIAGRLFREFSITISAAILVSGLVSLTLTPMLASRFLTLGTGHKVKSGKFLPFLEMSFNYFEKIYEKSLIFVLHHRKSMLYFTFGTLVISVFLYFVVPKGFIPLEDNGFVFTQTEGDQDISYEEMVKRQQVVAQIVQEDPAVVSVLSAVGSLHRALNSGIIFFALKPLSKRDSIFVVMERLRKKFQALQGIQAYMQPIQNIPLGARLTRGFYQYTIQSSDYEALEEWASKMTQQIAHIPGTVDVSNDLQMKSLQVLLEVEKEKAYSLGITYGDIRKSLYNSFGTAQVATLYTPTNYYRIILEVTLPYQKNMEDLKKIYIPTTSGQLIDLNSISKFKRTNTPLLINHEGQLPSATISFNLATGTALGTVVDKINQIQSKYNMPPSIYTSFQGVAQEFLSSLKGTLLLLLLAIAVIYIVLGMLYESFIHPITILSGLPSAGIGAIVALMIAGMELDIISMIGIILLIGIVKKNAIMMIDFALAEKEKGEDAETAIYNACLLRFRPIMMTTFSAFFATLPIALGMGAGAELRRPLGVAVVGGLFFSQFITLYITPVVFIYLEKARYYPWKDKIAHLFSSK